MQSPLLTAEIGSTRLEIIVADITTLAVDAIVNAANVSLLGGGGVDGAIHRAAGPQLLDECKTLGGCRTGSAKITRGYGLPALNVIHAVGPVYHGGRNGEEQKLAAAHLRALELADERGLATLSFPAISCGAYGYPPQAAATIAVDTLRSTTTAVEHATLVAFDARTRHIYDELLSLS